MFVCVDCQADAKKFIEIQDAIWDPAGDADTRAGELSKEAQKPSIRDRGDRAIQSGSLRSASDL